MTLVNRRWLLAARPTGMVKPSDFSLVEAPVPEPGANEAVIQVEYISLDPAMRGWMNDARSYIAPIKLGEVIRALAIGRVIASNNPALAVGGHVTGMFGIQEYAVTSSATPLDPAGQPLPVHLAALGMPGLTAYFGLLDVGKPKAGETVVVSGAAGAVGMVVGQIAKLHDCRVIGIAGGPDKCAYVVDELGFTAAIDYKAGDIRPALREHCPRGIDVYFDNVGGSILDAALGQLAMHARVVICGAISQYNSGQVVGPSNYLALLVSRSSMTGMLVFDYAARYGEGLRELAGWMAAGKLRSREHIVHGIAAFPAAFQQLFTGENFGKAVLAVGAG